jgi:membrane-associated phospholipid phosphatase
LIPQRRPGQDSEGVAKRSIAWRTGCGLFVRLGALLVLWVCLTGILIASEVAVVHSAVLTAFDRRATAWAVEHRSPPLDALMKAVTWGGSWVAVVAAGVMIAVLAARRRIPILAVGIAVVVWAGEAAGVGLTKEIVQRPRPPERLWLTSANGWSWPSGHAAVAAVVFTTLAVIVAYLGRTSAYRAVAWPAAALAVVAVGFSRIELGVHWTTDVIASLAFVVPWLLGVAAVFRTASLHAPPRPRPSQ